MQIELLFDGAYTLVVLATGVAAGAYLRQKGKNLATKDDIGEITDEVERVRRQHQEEIEMMRTELAKTVHVHRAQFETELRAYRAVWKTLVEAKRATLQLRPPLDATPEDETEAERRQRRLTDFDDAFKDFRDTVDRWRPFYPVEIYEELNDLLLLIRDEGVEYGIGADRRLDPSYWESAQENKQEIIKTINDICDTIRARMEDLTVAEG